jgi:hypothetical protein
VSDHNRITITDAEILVVGGGVDDATRQPVVRLTPRRRATTGRRPSGPGR